MNNQSEHGIEARQPGAIETALTGGTRHMPALDGVRGLAILLVLIYHLLGTSDRATGWLVQIAIQARQFGWSGVNLFFALSGFLITGILLNTRDAPNYFKNFYARRALRIFPLYYGFFLLLFIAGLFLHFSWNGWQFLFLTYTANLALPWVAPPSLAGVRIGHLWSLQVEEQFYLLWPLAVSRVRDSSKLARFCMVGCAGALLLRIAFLKAHLPGAINAVYILTFCCCDALLYGCALALLLHAGQECRVRAAAPAIFAFCILAIVAERVIDRDIYWADTFFVPTFGFTLIGIASAALIAMSLRPGSVTQKLLSVSPLRFLGRYSYGIYILHNPIYGFLSEPLRQFFFRWFHPHAIGILLAALVVAGISIAGAVLSYHLYEVHFLRLKRYFKERQVQALS